MFMGSAGINAQHIGRDAWRLAEDVAA